jgi:hypothetical protein
MGKKFPKNKFKRRSLKSLKILDQTVHNFKDIYLSKSFINLYILKLDYGTNFIELLYHNQLQLKKT